MAALYRWMCDQPDAVGVGEGLSGLPSLATLYRAVHEEQGSGRVLEVSRPAYARQDPDRYDRALAELALPGTVDETGLAVQASAAGQLGGGGW
ncbi:hypothetical protein [Streptomyces sp. NPDC001530]|uniref:hypothetical protein n=1 Tax=Streptomyces sp. NPDC001530 TaxID=3364582 RepID=UPI0036B7D031